MSRATWASRAVPLPPGDGADGRGERCFEVLVGAGGCRPARRYGTGRGGAVEGGSARGGGATPVWMIMK